MGLVWAAESAPDRRLSGSIDAGVCGGVELDLKHDILTYFEEKLNTNGIYSESKT